MDAKNSQFTDLSRDELVSRLQAKGINPTSQRLDILGLLLQRCEHLSADQVFNLLNGAGNDRVSKATVYNTLGLFAKKGVVREVIADPARVFYDPNTEPHHHIYNVTDGSLIDIDGDLVEFTGLPGLPDGTRLEGVDIIVRVSQT
jgi:Fur family iron response transcriptional regulator